MKFGEILRNLLEDRDMTQKQLAADLNIAPSTLGNYVQNTREPDFETLKRIADYFDITPDYLLDYHSDKIRSNSEDELLRIFRALNTDQQQLYLEQGKAFFKIYKQ